MQIGDCVVENVAVEQLSFGSFAQHHRIMWIIATPGPCLFVPEPDFPVWIPTAMPYPATAIVIESGHRIGIEVSRASFFYLPDFPDQFFTQALVAVERDDPVVFRVLQVEMLLLNVACKLVFYESDFLVGPANGFGLVR